LSSPNPISTAPPPPLPPQRTPPLSSFLFPSYLPPRDLHSFPTRRSSDLSALRLFPPGLEVALDLARVLLQVLRVDREPVLRAVRARLRVPAHATPVLLGRALQQRHGIRPHGRYGGQRRVDRMCVVIEALRPAVLVVSDDQRVGLREQVAQPHV